MRSALIVLAATRENEFNVNNNVPRRIEGGNLEFTARIEQGNPAMNAYVQDLV
jgi:hypothetical protein